MRARRPITVVTSGKLSGALTDEEERRCFERDGYPAGVPCWIDTAQPDVDAATDFYRGLFGWDFEDGMPADAPGRYCVARLHGLDVAAVGSQPEGAPPPDPFWSTYVWVDDADASATEVDAAGGTVLAEPFDVLDAGRMAAFADPSGAVFNVWQAGTHRGAQLVNEPGTWNWSDLNARDIESAKAFYGRVFGWETDTVDFGFGFGEANMIRRPGYADFLEQIAPGVRSRHAEAGAPDGFTEAIGWMNRMTRDQFPDDVPPHWNVTFTVDDTDAVADRAAQLGGDVVTPPFDAGPVRMAVVRDPHGAVFTASRYQPG